MADINVERKGGTPWLWWIIGLIVLALIVWGIWEWTKGRKTTTAVPADTAAAVMPADTTTKAVPPPAPTKTVGTMTPPADTTVAPTGAPGAPGADTSGAQTH